jgi:hypothetical protein
MQDDDNEDNVGGQIDTENGRRIRQEVIETIFKGLNKLIKAGDFCF